MEKLPKPPKWAPTELVEILEAFGSWPSVQTRDIRLRLITDPRMEGVWKWHKKELARDGDLGKFQAIKLAFFVERGLTQPSKPRNLTKKKRHAYFAKVNRHAEALIVLLDGTAYWHRVNHSTKEKNSYIDPEKLQQSVTADLKRRNSGGVVAYQVSREGVCKLPWNFPQCDLTMLLKKLSSWAQSDGSILNRKSTRSNSPLDYVHSDSAQLSYFCCTVQDALVKEGLHIPFPLLATLAEVALKLDDQLDPDTVRRQISRYRERQ